MSTPSDTPEIQPALTSEEWGAVVACLTELRDVADNAADYHGSQEAAVAAIRLTHAIDSIEDGTPFGFTWEHHDAIDEAVMTWRAEAGSFDDPATPSVNEHERAKYALMLEALEKLAALLPPKEESAESSEPEVHPEPTEDATLAGIPGKGGAWSELDGFMIEGHGLWRITRDPRNPDAFDQALSSIREWFEEGCIVEYRGPLRHEGQTQRVATRAFLRSVSNDFPAFGEPSVTVKVETTGRPEPIEMGEETP